MQACISIPGFSLQVLARRDSLPVDAPIAVISADRPSAHVVALNRVAFAGGIHHGMRYSQVLSLLPEIYASPVSVEEERLALREIRSIILRFTPDASEISFERAHFMVPIAGLLRLFASARQWSDAVLDSLAESGFRGCVGIAEEASIAYIAAKVQSRSVDSPIPDAHLYEWMERQSLALLPLPPREAETLQLLGMTTIGSFLSLPERQLKTRFSRETMKIYRFFRSGVGPRTEHEDESIVRERRYEPPLVTRGQVERAVEPLLREATAVARHRGVWVRGVDVTLVEEDGTERRERVESARSQQIRRFCSVSWRCVSRRCASSP